MQRVSRTHHFLAIANGIFRALKEECKTELQLHAAHTRIKKLRRHCKVLDAKSATGATGTADAFLALARSDCLELCTNIYTTFPREVRDTIYGYITSCENVIIDCVCYGVICYSEHCSKELCFDPSEDTTDHWWKPEHVGAAMVRELGENFYRSSCFVVQGDIAALGPFRATDQWNLGFPPVDFVSKIEVKINCQDYKFKLVDRTHIDPAADQHLSRKKARMLNEKNMRINATQKSLLVNLESLFGFRAGTKITIKLVSEHPKKYSALEQQEWMSHNVVPVILPVLTRLKATGCRVRILLSVEICWRTGTFATTWDQTCLEAITKEFWEVCDKKITRTSS